jgi:hypothetical protein
MLKISSKFMKGVLNLCLGKMIQKKIGYKIDIQINDLDIRINEGKVHLKASIDGETTTDELERFVKSAL